MVERLKEAIAKAREQRAAQTARPAQPGPLGAASAAAAAAPAWDALPSVDVPPAQLSRARVVAARKTDPASVAVDLLRTRVLTTMRRHGWRRVGVSSPAPGCGKSFTALNLAYSMARNAQLRVALLELDLRRPSLASLLGLTDGGCATRFLHGDGPLEDAFVRIAPNLAVAAARRNVGDSAELLQSATTAEAVRAIGERLAPDVLIMDLPPVLTGDDTLSALPLLDALLLVAAAGATTAAQIQECERLIEGGTAFLGVVLNKVHPADVERGIYADYAGGD